MEEEKSELRKQALQKIGRNVLNFQRMEKAIKSLIVASNLQGHASDLAEISRKKSEKVDRRSMGVLVDEFLKAVYTNELPGEGPSKIADSSDEIWMSFSFRVERDEQHIRALREALLRVVHERNELIHHMLWAFDPSSDEHCQDLISKLDEQNERLGPYYDWVMQMLSGLRNFQQELLANLENILLAPRTDSRDDG